jgi:O-antigen ligase
MNPTRLSDSQKDGIVAAIAVLVLLVGTATGNAYLMLAMAIAALLVISILVRQSLWRNLLLAMFGAAIGAVVTVAIMKL